MIEQSDEDIAQNVQNGNTQTFSILVERYEPKMTRYIKRFLSHYEDTQDTVQDVFIKAYTNIHSFDTSRRFSPWIYRIAHNAAINVIKKRAKEALPFFDADTIFPHPVAKQTADKQTEINQLKDALEKCLDQLKPTYREPIILYFFEDLDYKEIADIMHIPITTVGVRINRAKKQLKELYEQ